MENLIEFVVWLMLLLGATLIFFYLKQKWLIRGRPEEYLTTEKRKTLKHRIEPFIKIHNSVGRNDQTESTTENELEDKINSFRMRNRFYALDDQIKNTKM